MPTSSFPNRSKTRHRPSPALLADRVTVWRFLAALAAGAAAVATAVEPTVPPLAAVVVIALAAALIGLLLRAVQVAPVSDDELLAVADVAEVPARHPGRGRHALVQPSNTPTGVIPQVTA